MFTQEVDEKAIHAAANAVLAEETWRALLARDVADVERYCQELDDGYDDDPDVLAHMPTCAAWLTRARAALT